MIRATKWLGALAMICLLAACDPTQDLKDPPKPMGAFRLGHNIVVARDPTVGLASLTATEAEWQAAITKAVADRFGRYDGDRLYHIGISVDGYILSVLDAPLVPTPKPVLIVTANVWDDALGRKLNAEAKRITVLGGTFAGTGIAPSREAQMANLAASVAKAVQNWLLEHPDWLRMTAAEAAVPAN
ncbi:MAG: hypothetical protein QNJ16_13695 [Rhodobacter sp.]|nr:hypothetical protein [Rhodobacter sp.]